MIPLDMAPQRLLAVAQSLEHIEPMVASLRAAGCRVEIATTPQEAIARAAVLNPEIVVIDEPLTGANTVELTMALRTVVKGNTSPTFIMTMNGDSMEHKTPTSVNDTPASFDPMSGRLTRSGLCLDRIRHRAWIDDRVLHLTPTEFKLLWELMKRPGYVLQRSDLTKLCRASTLPIQTRTIDAHIKSIRRKLCEHAHRIETVHGIGYRFEER